MKRILKQSSYKLSKDISTVNFSITFSGNEDESVLIVYFATRGKNLFCECEVRCLSKARVTTTRLKLIFYLYHKVP